MIHREGDEIRVERDHWRVWVPVAVGEGFLVALALIFVITAIPERRTAAYGAAVAMLLIGVLIAVYYHRRQDVLVITPDEVAYSYGGRMFRVPRSEVAYVRLVPIVLFLAVVLHDSAGEVRHKLLFNDLVPKDLREALDEAGIPVR